jgi:hypothetical protein
VELVQKDLSITDTINGLISRTGGYPSGFLGKAKFATYKFKAVKPGDAKIYIATGNAYNQNNLDVGVKRADLNLSIDGSTEESTTSQTKSYDLDLIIKSKTAFYKQDDYTFTLYHKKEKKIQQAVTKIWLFDENWNVKFEDEKLWRTDQDTVLNFVIPGGTVESEGNYKIIAKVRYEDNREFEVAEKDVGVLSNGQTWFTKNASVFMPIFWVVVLAAALHHIFAERELYFKLQSFLKREKRKSSPRARKTLNRNNF